MREARFYPLVGIIEFLYHTMKYFYEHANAAHAAMADSQKLYSTAMTAYLDMKQKQAISHQAEHEPIHRASDSVLTVYNRIKLQVDLQADKSPVVVKGPFFPRVVNPRYQIRGTNV
jgi:hypothetical protein